MSNRRQRENQTKARRLIHVFDTIGYPNKYPRAMEFLCKVDINKGHVNTDNQQDTLDTLYEEFYDN